MSKTILCFGDSNTWGWDPVSQTRFGPEVRWPGVLRAALGDGYSVIEEGLCGRTTVLDDPLQEHRNGRRYLPPCLLSHQPLDLVIVLLGTNDLKTRFSMPAYDIAQGVGILVDAIQRSEAGRNGAAPAVLVVAPPPLRPEQAWGESMVGGYAKSLQLAAVYRPVAEIYGCDFFDAGQVIASSEVDGVHWEVGEHQKLGQAVAGLVREILNR